MACRVTTTAKSGRYRIVTDYVTDTKRAAIITSVTFVPLVGSVSDYHLYVRFDPTVNGNGGGGAGNGGADTGAVDTSTGSPIPVASDTVTTTNAANRDYAQPVFAALDASTPFLQVTNGYAGQASDGLVQLDAAHALTESNDSAAPGNLVQTAEVTLPATGTFELALGLGADQASAVGAAAASLRPAFDQLLARYTATWQAYDAGLNRPDFQALGATRKEAAKLRSTYLLSANVLKASEDKTFPGAIVAGLASPWGQAVSAGDPANTYFGSYREVFARDLYEAYTGLLTDGDLATAKAATLFLFERQQQPDGSMPRNSLVNGKTAPDSSTPSSTRWPIPSSWPGSSV
jgi:GH15 family glucan-1,4-alpha-glucosidase